MAAWGEKLTKAKTLTNVQSAVHMYLAHGYPIPQPSVLISHIHGMHFSGTWKGDVELGSFIVLMVT